MTWWCLIFQTVKYFNNEAFETEKYDEFLKSKSFEDILIYYGIISPESNEFIDWKL